MITVMLIICSSQTETEVKARYEFTILDLSKNKQNRVKSTFTQFKVGFKTWWYFQCILLFWGFCHKILQKCSSTSPSYNWLSKPSLQAKPDSWGFRKFISTDFLKSRASQWLPEDNLTIVCDVSIIGDHFVSLWYWEPVTWSPLHRLKSLPQITNAI